MPVVTVTIRLDVPEGTDVQIESSAPSIEAEEGIPADVLDAISRLVPTRYREWVELYVTRAIGELGCTVVMPIGDRQHDYLNIYPPEWCRRKRVSGVTYSSSRTAIFTGPVDLSGYELAQETLHSGRYAYPKLPHLDGESAVGEAIELTKLAIGQRER